MILLAVSSDLVLNPYTTFREHKVPEGYNRMTISKQGCNT